jgi:Fe-S-cluster-containing hydrogenase component 2
MRAKIMHDFDREMTEIEAIIVELESQKLLDLIRTIDSEAEACKYVCPDRALRLLQACNVGTQILQRRVGDTRNLQPTSSHFIDAQ